MLTPYYEHGGITIYHGDAREIVRTLTDVDLVLTDPPYPDAHTSRYNYSPDLLDSIADLTCRQFVCWSARADFPLSFTAVHIWDKKTGCACEYERIFERNGHHDWKVFRHYLINSTMAAAYTGDDYTGHPSQKPRRLLMDLLRYAQPSFVLDPFMGSGSTLQAAKRFGARAIGIEREERWCAMAAERLSQSVLPLEAVG